MGVSTSERALSVRTLGELCDEHRVQGLRDVRTWIGDDLEQTDAFHAGDVSARGHGGGIGAELDHRGAQHREVPRLVRVDLLDVGARGPTLPGAAHIHLRQHRLVQASARSLEREALAELVEQHLRPAGGRRIRAGLGRAPDAAGAGHGADRVRLGDVARAKLHDAGFVAVGARPAELAVEHEVRDVR